MQNEVHSFRTTFDLVDLDTGEVLTRNKKHTIVTDTSATPDLFYTWLDCFYRGLLQGRNLAIQISASKFCLSKELNLF